MKSLKSSKGFYRGSRLNLKAGKAGKLSATRSTKKPSKSIKISHHSVSGSQSSVMVLDKKLINFKDPLEGEKSKGSTSGKVKIMPGTTQVVRERKMLSSNNKPVKTQAPKSQIATASASTTDVDPDNKAILENPAAEENLDIVQSYKSQRN